MRKDNPPIPVGIETGGLESLQRFETHWKVQKKGNSFRMFRVGSGDGASTNFKREKQPRISSFTFRPEPILYFPSGLA